MAAPAVSVSPNGSSRRDSRVCCSLHMVLLIVIFNTYHWFTSLSSAVCGSARFVLPATRSRPASYFRRNTVSNSHTGVLLLLVNFTHFLRRASLLSCTARSVLHSFLTTPHHRVNLTPRSPTTRSSCDGRSRKSLSANKVALIKKSKQGESRTRTRQTPPDPAPTGLSAPASGSAARS